MARRKIPISTMRKIKPVQMQVHPDFFAMSEKFRTMLINEGIKPSQLKITKLMVNNIQLPNKRFFNGTKKN